MTSASPPSDHLSCSSSERGSSIKRKASGSCESGSSKLRLVGPTDCAGRSSRSPAAVEPVLPVVPWNVGGLAPTKSNCSASVVASVTVGSTPMASRERMLNGSRPLKVCSLADAVGVRGKYVSVQLTSTNPSSLPVHKRKMTGATSIWSLDEDALFYAYQGGPLDFTHPQQSQTEAWSNSPCGDVDRINRDDDGARRDKAGWSTGTATVPRSQATSGSDPTSSSVPALPAWTRGWSPPRQQRASTPPSQCWASLDQSLHAANETSLMLRSTLDRLQSPSEMAQRTAAETAALANASARVGSPCGACLWRWLASRRQRSQGLAGRSA